MSSSSYVNPPPAGYDEVYGSDVNDAHDAHSADFGCGGTLEHDWRSCPTFAVARLTSICSTVYVLGWSVQDYRVLVEWTSGPTSSLGGWLSTEPLTWSAALHAAVREVESNPEVSDN